MKITDNVNMNLTAESRIIGIPASTKNPAQVKSGLGQTEDEAICLSDDEEDASLSQKENSQSQKTDTSKISSTTETTDSKILGYKSKAPSQWRVYNQYFGGSTFGIQLVVMNNRLVVASNRFGNAKPARGDVLIAVNGLRLNLGCALNEACDYMKRLLKQGVVELTFLEDERLAKYFEYAIQEQERGENEAAIGNHMRNPWESSVSAGQETCYGCSQDMCILSHLNLNSHNMCAAQPRACRSLYH